MAGPNLPNLDAFIAAGINPKTGLPLKMGGDPVGLDIVDRTKRILRITDEQDAVRGSWYNVPEGLDSTLIERILYYKGRGMLFHIHGQFYFLPFALNGELDVYGRYKGCSPLPFYGKSEKLDGTSWISNYKFNPIYSPLLPFELTKEIFEEGCVILNDYTPQLSQIILPRAELNDALIEQEAYCMAYLNTALMNSTGIEAIKVNDESEESNVFMANLSVQRNALTGQKFIPVLGKLDMQNLTSQSANRADTYLLAMQSLDNMRLGTHGLTNGGIFEKKAYENLRETAMSASTMSPIMMDRTWNRQNFCNIVNSIWHIGLWYEPPETGTGMDVNGDGRIYEETTPAPGTPVEDEGGLSDGN